MARSWQEAIDTGAPGVAAPEPEETEERKGAFRRLRESLSRSRQALQAEVAASVSDKLDGEAFERLEEALITADVGAPTTAEVVGKLEAEVESGELAAGAEVRDRLVALLADLAASDADRIDLRARPAVVMVVGVNGTGKTTTIGKLAHHLRSELGLSVIMAAGDTYRAAAQEQLAQWAERVGCDIVGAQPGSDPGAVVFDAIEAARNRGHDVVIADTAGRLHTQVPLMEELSKVRRVIEKQLPGAPHETLLTVDATTGQNGLRQAQAFAEAVEVTGVVLTKLDGTAKGGIALAIAGELGIPVKLIGIGEGVEDLRPFDARDFARALLQNA